MPKNQFLVAGKVHNTHGVKGEIVVESYCDDLKTLLSLKFLFSENGDDKYEIENARTHKNKALIKLKNHDTIESVNKLKGKLIYLDRNELHLPENRYFIEDLISLPVYDYESKEKLGILTFIYKTSANDIYEIKLESGKEELIANTEEMIPLIDIDKGIFINSKLAFSEEVR